MAIQFLNSGYFAGRVGVGIAAPETGLHVKGAADDNESLLYIENTYSSGGVFFPAALFKHTASNHSYGTVAEFRTEGTASDRPSILFSNGHTTNNWSIGQGVSGASDNFVIGYRSFHPNTSGGWATPYLTIATSGDATFAGDVTLSAAGSTGETIRTTNNTEPYLALQRNSGSNGVGVLRLLDGGDLTFDTGATGAGQTTRLTIDGATGNATFAGDIMPSAENLYDIGSASVRWEDIWADQVYGRDVYVDTKIIHNGDTDNFIEFGTDTISISKPATFAGDIAMVQTSGNNTLTIDSSGGGAPVIYYKDPTRTWGQFVSNGDMYFKDETSQINSLILDGGTGNATFAGDIIMANAKVLYTDDIRASTGGMVIGPTGNSSLTLRTNSTTRLTINSGGLATFSSTPDVGTRSAGDNTTRAASTAFVTAAVAAVPIGNYLPLAGGTMTGKIVGPTAGNSSANPPALEVVASGTANTQASIAIQQKTSEGDTIIFADYEPHVEWGISTENGANLIHFTGGSTAGGMGSKTFYNNSGNARTAYIKFEHNTTNGNTKVGGTFSVASSSTFAAISATNGIFTGYVSGHDIYAQNFYVTSSGTSAVNRIDNDGNNLYITYGGTSSRALEIANNNGNATFAGDVTVNGGQLFLPDGGDVAWAGGYSSGKPVIAGNSTVINMYPAGNVSGAQFSLSSTTATFAGALTGTTASFNSGTGNVVASFISTDGIAGIKLQDSGGNVELSASSNTFQVQPAGGAAALSVTSTAATFAGTVTSSAGGFGVNYLGGQTVPMIVLANAPTYGIFYRESTPDFIEFKHGNVVKQSFDGSGNVTLAGKGTSVATVASDGGTTLATKSYVDGLVTGVPVYKGTWNASTNSPDLTLPANKILGNYYIVDTPGTSSPNGGTTEPDSWAVGDWCIFSDVTPGAGTDLWQRIDNSSVISGAGTGQKLAKWSGASNADSETLTDSSITDTGSVVTIGNPTTITGPLTVNMDADDTVVIKSVGTNASAVFAASGDELYLGGGDSYSVRYPAGNNFALFDNSNPGIAINTGNMNIGSAGPASDLTSFLNIVSTVQGVNPTINVSCDDADEASLILSEESGNQGYGARLYYQGNGNNFFNIQIGDVGTWTNRFTIDRYGDVGVGILAPQGKMTVVGATQTINMDLDANSAIGLSVMGVDSSNFNAFTIGSANSQNNCGVIRFKYNGAGSTNNYMGLGFYSNDDILNVRANGYVGIGVTSPTANLHVQGSSATDVPIIRSGGFGNSGSALELAETLVSGNMTYGFSFEQTGNGTNELLIKRHNNSQSGAPVITLSRTNNNVSMSGGLSLALKATSSSTVSTDSGTTLTTKNYVDALTPGAGVFLPLAGGTMTGNITLPGEENNTFKIGFTGASATSGLSTVDQNGAGLYIGANSKLNNSGNVVYNNSALPSSGIYFDGWDGDDMEFYTGASGNPIKRLTISSTGDATFAESVILGATSNGNAASKLTIASGTNGDGIFLTGLGNASGMGTGNYKAIDFQYSNVDSSFGSAIRFVVADNTLHGGQIEFWTDNSSGTNTKALTLDKSQNATFAGTITTGGDLTIGGTGGIFIPEYIYHTGDGNTYFGFPSNDIFRVATGGTARFEITASTVNVSNAPFKALGALATGSGIAETGVGLGQMSNYAHAQFSGSAGGYIDFAEPNVDYSGRIIYTHSSDSMVFYTATSVVLTLDSNNNSTFAGEVLVNGNLETVGTSYLYLSGHVRMNNPGSGAFNLDQYDGSSWNDTLNITSAGAATFAGDVTIGGRDLIFSNTGTNDANITSSLGINFIVAASGISGLEIDAFGGVTTYNVLTTGGSIIVGGGGIQLNGTGRIEGIDTVSDSTDAANKAYVDTAVAGAGSGTFLPLAGGTMTGKLLSPRTSLNRVSNAASGYNYYNETINGWQTYMSPAGATSVGYNGNLTAPAGTYVTSWAIRSVVEPVSGYGWTWEELASGATTGQSVVAELSSSSGNFKTIGNIYAAGGNSTQWNTHTSNTGTVTSVATGGGLDGGTITTTGTIEVEYDGVPTNIIQSGFDFTGDTVVSGDYIMISNPGSTSTNRRIGYVTVGDLPFTNNSGDITGVTAGTGLTGGGTSGGVTLNVDYLGSDSIIKAAPTLSAAVASSDFLLMAASNGNVFETTFSNLPFVSSNDSTVIRTTGGQTRQGNNTFAATSTSTSYTNAGVELRESNLSGSSGTPPFISWHWGGVVASSMTIENNGTIAVRNNPGNAYEKFACSNLTAHGGTFVLGSGGVGDMYLGNNATNKYFRFHTNNNQTYFDMNCGQINWREGSSTRYYFYPSTANMTINGTLTQNSDSRVKENVVEIDNCISKVQAMRGVYYNRTDFNTEVTKVGVIAQEVEAVLPELILEASDTGLKSVAYAELTAVLINAIKEQQEIIEDLKARVQQLEK